MNLELKKAIDQISKDKGIDRDMLIDTLEEAIRASVVKRYGENLDVEVNFDDETGEINVHQFKIVVDDVYDPDTEILFEDALKHDPQVVLDDEVGFKMEVRDLGRIAAQSAKQVIIQRMRDAEQEIIYEEYRDRKGEITSGIIQRRDRTGWIINLGRTEALLPRDEQIPKERFRQGDRVQGYIIDVRKEGRGPQVIISRSHPDYMNALFHREVPEISDGTVSIMGVARDPGMRAKVAVLSKEMDVDPVGACVGVKGSRIQNIVQELRGERVDIVIWSPDIVTYAVNALSPARISRIMIDEEEKTLEVVVPDDQLTPAIGRKGQNVKLASRLLGWRIDVFTESKYVALHPGGRAMDQVASAAGISLENFIRAGFEEASEIANASDDELLAVSGMTESKISDLRAALNLLDIDTTPPESKAEPENVPEDQPKMAEENQPEAGQPEQEEDDNSQSAASMDGK